MEEHEAADPGPRVRRVWLAVILAAYALAGLVVAANAHDRLWFIDEEEYIAHGVRIVHSGTIGSQIDSFQPPLSFYVHGALLLVHPDTPNLSGPIEQDPAISFETPRPPGARNPVLHDSVWHQVRTHLDAVGSDPVEYVFWARVPLIVFGMFGVFIAWQFTEDLGWNPWPATALVALSHTYVIETTRIVADGVAAVLMLVIVWRCHRLAARPSLRESLVLGIAIGAAVSAKLSSLPIVAIAPMLIVLFRLTQQAGDHVWSGVLASVREILRPMLVVAPVAFLTLWGSYGFQLGSLEQATRLHMPWSETLPRALQEHEALATATIPMPSFVMAFATNRQTVAHRTNPHLRIDERPAVSLGRKLAYYSRAILSGAGWITVPLALLAGLLIVGRDPHQRWTALALWIVPCAYLAGAWTYSLTLSGRRMIPLAILFAVLAGAAWRRAPTPLERRLRTPVLVFHLAWSAVMLVRFIA